MLELTVRDLERSPEVINRTHLRRRDGIASYHDRTSLWTDPAGSGEARCRGRDRYVSAHPLLRCGTDRPRVIRPPVTAAPREPVRAASCKRQRESPCGVVARNDVIGSSPTVSGADIRAARGLVGDRNASVYRPVTTAAPRTATSRAQCPRACSAIAIRGSQLPRSSELTAHPAGGMFRAASSRANRRAQSLRRRGRHLAPVSKRSARFAGNVTTADPARDSASTSAVPCVRSHRVERRQRRSPEQLDPVASRKLPCPSAKRSARGSGSLRPVPGP